MKNDNEQEDTEEIPMKLPENKNTNTNRNSYRNKSTKFFYKNAISFIFILFVIFVMMFLADNNSSMIELNNHLNGLQNKVQYMDKNIAKKKNWDCFRSSVLIRKLWEIYISIIKIINQDG